MSELARTEVDWVVYITVFWKQNEIMRLWLGLGWVGLGWVGDKGLVGA